MTDAATVPNLAIVPKEDFEDEQGPLLEDGERYNAVLTGFSSYENQYGPRLVWQFAVEDDGDSVEAAGFTSYSMSAGKMKSTLIKWTEAIVGEIPVGFTIADLVGKPCRVDIELYTKESGITKNKVIKVSPAKGSKAEAAATAQADADKNEVESDFEDIPF